MSQRTCYIVDHDREAVDGLMRLLFKYDLGRVLGTATSIDALSGETIDFLNANPVDFLFIRISYWDDWLKTKPIRPLPGATVFLSGSHDKCTRHLAHEVDFHLQPPYRFAEVVGVFRQHSHPFYIPRPLDFFFVRANCRYHAVYFSAIRNIESKAGFLTIHTRTADFNVAGCLADIQNRFPLRFSRVGRSLLIANPI